jgi:hypothetical protein
MLEPWEPSVNAGSGVCVCVFACAYMRFVYVWVCASHILYNLGVWSEMCCFIPVPRLAAGLGLQLACPPAQTPMPPSYSVPQMFAITTIAAQHWGDLSRNWILSKSVTSPSVEFTLWELSFWRIGYTMLCWKCIYIFFIILISYNVL